MKAKYSIFISMLYKTEKINNMFPIGFIESEQIFIEFFKKFLNKNNNKYNIV